MQKYTFASLFLISLALMGCQPDPTPPSLTPSNQKAPTPPTPPTTLGTEPQSTTTTTTAPTTDTSIGLTAKDILGRPDHLAFCYGGYRKNSREFEPTVDQLKDDMRILSAMGVKILRTYNTQQFKHAATLLQAIHELKQEDSKFRMYVMLGAWIDCEGAWSDDRNHEAGNEANNKVEVAAAVALANKYPDIVKIIAVGNEAMVHWATQYFVHPRVILKWVDHLQTLKSSGKLGADVWITSSDNYESWGGGSTDYHNDDLVKLIKAVDYVSLHTYPFHETHYDPEFWAVPADQAKLSLSEQADAAVARAQARGMTQYETTAAYIKSLGIDKPIHIGETGWASVCGSSYGAAGSQAADEYKSKRFYDSMREWTNGASISCFYFEAFDETWKDPGSASGSENHFGMINKNGQAKYALWDQVDAGTFKGLTRDGATISKTFNGDEAALRAAILPTPLLSDLGILVIKTTNVQRNAGEPVTEATYVVTHPGMVPNDTNKMTYPSANVKLNTWEGTCNMEMSRDGIIHIESGSSPDSWWGCGLEIQSSESGENLTPFKTGTFHFEIKGSTAADFDIGFQSGKFIKGNQVNNFVTFGPNQKYKLSDTWKSHSIPIADLNKNANFGDVTGLLYVRGGSGDGKDIEIRNVFYTQE
jgi:exo-beta-1,3-glucanase (GH17 family)